MAFCIKGFQHDRGVVNRLEELQEPCDRWISCLLALALGRSSLAQVQLEFTPRKRRGPRIWNTGLASSTRFPVQCGDPHAC